MNKFDTKRFSPLIKRISALGVGTLIVGFAVKVFDSIFDAVIQKLWENKVFPFLTTPKQVSFVYIPWVLIGSLSLITVISIVLAKNFHKRPTKRIKPFVMPDSSENVDLEKRNVLIALRMVQEERISPIEYLNFVVQAVNAGQISYHVGSELVQKYDHLLATNIDNKVYAVKFERKDK